MIDLIKNNKNIDLNLLRKFVPDAQLEVMIDLVDGEEGKFYLEKLEDLTKTIKNLPTEDDICEDSAKDIKAPLHYFVGGCDWYIATREKDEDVDPEYKGDYNVDPDYNYGFCFARLNNWYDCAELGTVYFKELMDTGMMQLDLHHDKNFTLQDAIDENKRLAKADRENA